MVVGEFGNHIAFENPSVVEVVLLNDLALGISV